MKAIKVLMKSNMKILDEKQKWVHQDDQHESGSTGPQGGGHQTLDLSVLLDQIVDETLQGN